MYEQVEGRNCAACVSCLQVSKCSEGECWWGVMECQAGVSIQGPTAATLMRMDGEDGPPGRGHRSREGRGEME